MLDGELCGLRCSREDCGAVHYMSFASGGKKLLPGLQQLGGGAARLPWFQPTVCVCVQRCSPVFTGVHRCSEGDSNSHHMAGHKHETTLATVDAHKTLTPREGHECSGRTRRSTGPTGSLYGRDMERRVTVSRVSECNLVSEYYHT